jgi:type II secretory pathway pseudopilin PulG
MKRDMKSTLTNERGISLIVVLMVMAIMLSVVGAGLLFSAINTKRTMNFQVGTRAFNAADTGINAVASSLALNPTFSATPVVLQQDTSNNTVLCYRFGRRDGTVPSPQPVAKSSAGFSLGSGTGYNASGYSFYQYQINVTGSFSTGTSCPAANAELAAREVEAQAMYGPVPQ